MSNNETYKEEQYNKLADNETPFYYLHKTMLEYKLLDIENKRKYMKILTEWYMREKDYLNMLEQKK